MKRLSILFVVTGIIGLGIAIPIVAQTSQADIDNALNTLNQNLQDQQNRQQFELQQQRRLLEKNRPTLDVKAPDYPVFQEGELPAFYISDIQLDGADHLPPRIKKEFLLEYLHPDITVNDINKMVRYLTNTYIELGYVTTRVYIPQQNLKSETLVLKVVEGVVTRFEIDGPASRAATAFWGQKGKVLNIWRLEQGLDQLNRLRSQTYTMKLIPDPTVVGGTIVRLVRGPQKQSPVTVRYDSYINPKIQWTPNSIFGEKGDLLYLSDQLQANFYQTLQGQRQYNNSLYLSYSVPFGVLTTGVTYSHFNYLSVVQGTNRNFTTSGRTRKLTGYIDWVVMRNRTTKFSIRGALGIKKVDSFIEDTRSDVGSRDLSILSLTVKRTYQKGRAFWSTSLDVDWGVPWFGAGPDPTPIAPLTPRFRYERYQLQSYYSLSIPVSNFLISLSSDTRLFFSNDTLFSSEQFSIGDYYSVRGYFQSFQGDMGGLTRNEIEIRPLRWLGVFTGLDLGIVRPKGGKAVLGADSKVILGSAVGGIKASVLNGVQLHVTYAYGISPTDFVTDRQGRVYFGADIALF